MREPINELRAECERFRACLHRITEMSPNSRAPDEEEPDPAAEDYAGILWAQGRRFGHYEAAAAARAAFQPVTPEPAQETPQ